MTRHALLWPLILALVLTAALAASAQEPGASPKGEAELREAIRAYDDALRRGDASAAERFWATEYVFINPRGERVTREARIANLRERRTSLDLVVHAPADEVIRTYMDGKMAVYTTRLSIDGRYGGEAERGEFRALVVWIHRDGRWQQLASQMTPVLPAR
ncbi:MAG TPA: nuclear transport factor 2 family protein [Steroidobacteraceae bacterium]|nr:nuclear transport factor 2 family protein [Steroidobacteraceae bacterium]